MKGFHPGCYGSGMADRWAQLVLGRRSQGPALLEVISQGHPEPFIRGVREASHPCDMKISVDRRHLGVETTGAKAQPKPSPRRLKQQQPQPRQTWSATAPVAGSAQLQTSTPEARPCTRPLAPVAWH
ncbi:hypothetical protein CKAH01_11321 [Colletotrichum kahawae]|uniref:Uncharacterized protein n=1 Tax=Colletotrichum kahawae TaxID=34407 RepID=A0AAD9YWD1_COLKA|nr:hypothetical protein CKAH01_11321 [Colletotrichum kahawae]